MSSERVFAVQRDLSWVVGGACGSGAWCSISGRLRHGATGPESFPAVGDFVRLREGTPAGREDMGIIEAVEPRKSCLTRLAPGGHGERQVIGANLDWVMIVTSCNHDFNLRRIERYLSIIWEAGALPMVLLSKVDLDVDWASLRARVDALGSGVPVVGVSARSGEGFDHLLRHVRADQTIGLVGSSGVGKSSILNRLLGGEVQATQEVRAGDDRGRHTTTSRSLHRAPEGFFVLDTPGMRELQISASEETVDVLFADVVQLVQKCRFSDCRHETEPGCAVQTALAAGQLNPNRYGSYRKLEKEAHWNAIRGNKIAMAEERRKWKRISKAQRVDKKRSYW